MTRAVHPLGLTSKHHYLLIGDNYPFSYGGTGAHIRDSYVQSLSQIADLRMDERSHESAILYVNGAYWGVYDIREKVDDLDFTEYYYDQGEGQLDFLKTWGGTWAEYGDENDWNGHTGCVFGHFHRAEEEQNPKDVQAEEASSGRPRNAPDRQYQSWRRDRAKTAAH